MNSSCGARHAIDDATARPPDLLSARRSVPTITQQATFLLGETTPDAMLLAYLDCVVETFEPNGALGTDLLRTFFPTTLVWAPLQPGRREEDGAMRTTACRLVLPQLIDLLSTHCYPLAGSRL
jgi:hypothetical protein